MMLPHQATNALRFGLKQQWPERGKISPPHAKGVLTGRPYGCEFNAFGGHPGVEIMVGFGHNGILFAAGDPQQFASGVIAFV